MGYIVKLIPDNLYFVPSDDGVETSDSREEAIETGQFDDYESAKETAESWSGQMIIGQDFIIEKISD